MLIAPDCFGDSLTAVEAAQAIAEGWRRARPDDTLIVAPQSDGGPGFVDVIAAAYPGMQVRRARVRGPLDADVDAKWVFDPATSTAYVECAQACGLALLGGGQGVAGQRRIAIALVRPPRKLGRAARQAARVCRP